MTSLPFNHDPRHVTWIQEVAERLTPRRALREFNYAALDFTMTVCVLRNPRCENCLLENDCRIGLLTDHSEGTAVARAAVGLRWSKKAPRIRGNIRICKLIRMVSRDVLALLRRFTRLRRFVRGRGLTRQRRRRAGIP